MDFLVKPPFTLEQFQQSIATVMHLEARRWVWLLGDGADLGALGIPAPIPYEFYELASTAQEAGLGFGRIAHTSFAKAMLDHFDLAFRAVLTGRSEPMHWDTVHTYYAAHLRDLTQSLFVEEWEGDGVPDLREAIDRCFLTIELSNARATLEGQGTFSYRVGGRGSEEVFANELNIRQVALLAGMEELSLRSMISRRTAPLLEVKKDERRSYVEIAAAREWLKAKGRYRPVQMASATSKDLYVQRFTDLDDLRAYLRHHAQFDSEVAKDIDKVLAAAGVKEVGEIGIELLENEGLWGDIAARIALPADLLQLRAKELRASLEIETRQAEIRLLETRVAAINRI